MSEQARLRWREDRQRWLPVVVPIQRTPHEIGAAVHAMIVQNGLTDVVVVGEAPGPKAAAKAYVYMIPSRVLWYAEMLRFWAIAGRWPNEDSRHGAPL